MRKATPSNCESGTWDTHKHTHIVPTWALAAFLTSRWGFAAFTFALINGASWYLTA